MLASPNYFSRRERWRLLGLVFILGLVLLLMNQARKPGSWEWLWRFGGADSSSIDRRPDRGEGHPLDSSVASAQLESDSAEHVSPGHFFPGVNSAYLTTIQDHTLFRTAERDAWFNLFDVLKRSSAAALEDASTGSVGFVQLLEQPAQYRGQLVTVHGEARRVLYFEAPDNEVGVEGYFQVILRPAGGPDSTLVIYCLELPDGFPEGDGIREEVHLTGFFFKNRASPTVKDIYSFPVLLTRNMSWSRPNVVAPEPIRPMRVAIMVLGTAILGVLMAAWVFRRSQRIALGTGRRVVDRFRAEGLVNDE